MNDLMQKVDLVKYLKKEVPETKPKEDGIIAQYDAHQLRLALRSLPDKN